MNFTHFCSNFYKYSKLFEGYKNFMALTNTSSKKMAIEQQRGVLQHRSTKLKADNICNEEFDEEESRHQHNQDLEDAVNDHFQDLKTVPLKRKIEPEVILKL